MPHKSSIDVVAVWIMTGIGNIIAQVTGLFNYITIIRELIAIASLLLAIAYTLYKFKKDWVGWMPHRKRKDEGMD